MQTATQTASPPLPSRRSSQSERRALDDGTRYLTCGVGDEIFALNVAQVREVLDLRSFSKVPNMPDHVRGMIDVRGQTVPVIDLRVKFGMAPAAATDATRIMVLEVVSGSRPLVIGALADRVIEVTELDAGEVEPPPEIGTRWRSEIIRGIGRRHGKFVIVLNLNRVFTIDTIMAGGGEDHA
ncbi:MAG: chemotaxis protein CheW [Rhodospirillaceae bacterium]